jgi:hypothetical protein
LVWAPSNQMFAHFCFLDLLSRKWHAVTSNPQYARRRRIFARCNALAQRADAVQLAEIGVEGAEGTFFKKT